MYLTIITIDNYNWGCFGFVLSCLLVCFLELEENSVPQLTYFSQRGVLEHSYCRKAYSLPGPIDSLQTEY